MISATVRWQRDSAEFTDNRYSRQHQWQFDGGLKIPASASPDIVRPPMSDPAAIDPEEAFVASLSSCHMLWFLSIAARGGMIVDSYRDNAQGRLGKNDNGEMAVTTVTLNPEIQFGGPQQPDRETVVAWHEQAHEKCFIANSVKTAIRCKPVFGPAQI